MSEVNRPVNKINNSLFLEYISNFSPPFLCPLFVLLTYYGSKEKTAVELPFIKWYVRGKVANKGKGNHETYLLCAASNFTCIYLRKLKRREKMSCFISQNADIFNMSALLKSSHSQRLGEHVQALHGPITAVTTALLD